MRRLLHGSACISFVSLFIAATLVATELSKTGRVTGTFEGIECEFSPGQEELARLLAHRLMMHNHEVAAIRPTAASAKTKTVPLSPAEMQANRAIYLQKITALLALEKPTVLQEECYDAFLGNYEQTMLLFQIVRDSMAAVQFKRLTIWERPELVRRLEDGEGIKGFTYDAATKSGRASFHSTLSQVQNNRLKELAEERKKLHLTYKLDFRNKDGVTNYRATASSKPRPTAVAAVAPTGSEMAAKSTEWLPIVIPVDLIQLPADELAEKLWSGSGDKSLAKILDGFARAAASMSTIDPNIAFLVLHETTELGVVDHYFRGPDRRWFCEGVANYVSWRVLRDLHGNTVALRSYNLPEQQLRYAGLRGQVDLRKWPASENQSESDQQSQLNSAHYVFATQAVTLMNERAGEDILPRLFKEIGRTKPNKVSIKTVEKAWEKLTGAKLDAVLAKVVLPLNAK